MASFLRVRYETDDEYEGLLQALSETIDPKFTQNVPGGKPIIQLAEPFDGVDHSYMITPLLGRYLQTQGFRLVHMVGKNSGPKWEVNLWDIAQTLKESAMESCADLNHSSPRFGWFCCENMISPAIERWHEIRKQTIKRPFMSTIERFINPFKAQVLVASAFHPPYGEKMLTIAERAGFKKIIIVRNGIEGTIAFPLLRPVKLLLSAQGIDGNYHRQELEIPEVGGINIEEKIERPQASKNTKLIENYLTEGSSGNIHFDLRLKATCEGIKKGLLWFGLN